ncbi:Dyp-type peroxidase [Colwellia psychrerythraea]|uniref:Putative melanin biosynthesis protein TyrA n=1 Tax=Colwellia psychrerythraea (strain 34H / ATCC BAA-681) TaxID=167879 RepID=Q47VP5_COLP3|nr:Dyp-type peroxidase [Colwellia psychrerythraea]AAZ27298.1 putative melanin biosynthesis protein TyrA [Colwellia psychrerythraea 34H]
MAREQFGICAEPNLHGNYLLFNALDDKNAFIRAAISRLPKLFDNYSDQFSEANLIGVVAIGDAYWDEFYPQARPAMLAPFPAMHSDDRVAPTNSYDIYIEIRSDRADVNHIVSTKVCELLGDSVELIEQVQAFRFLDGRDLTGFVDGTENPQGLHRREVALVKEQDDINFTGGSYLHTQRYQHNLTLWGSLAEHEQEDVYGRTKLDNVEYDSEDKALTAHTKRTSLKDEQGNSIEIVRQSMPYGDMKRKGLFFVSYCQSPKPFETMLKSMIHGDGHGNSDHLLKYTQAETGSAFFAPSLTFLAHVADID